MSVTFAKWIDVPGPKIEIWVGESPGREETRLMPESLMEKELYRWSYMTYSNMLIRIGRITKLDKLDCFLQVAKDKDGVNGWLFLTGLDRWFQLSGERHPYEGLARRPSGPVRVTGRNLANRRRELSNSTLDTGDDEIEGMPLGNWGKSKRIEKKKKEKPFVPPIRVIR